MFLTISALLMNCNFYQSKQEIELCKKLILPESVDRLIVKKNPNSITNFRYLKITKFCTLSFLQITLDRINAFIIASKTTTANYKGSAS